MVIAADYPFLDIFWTMIIFFCWVIWIWMVVLHLGRPVLPARLSGWVEGGVDVFIIVLPFLGVLST